jgi:hypothetical protein
MPAFPERSVRRRTIPPFPQRSSRRRRLSFGRRLLVAAAFAVAALVTATATTTAPTMSAAANPIANPTSSSDANVTGVTATVDCPTSAGAIAAVTITTIAVRTATGTVLAE